MYVHKFVPYDVPALDSLSGNPAYLLRKKLNDGRKMTREDKDYLTKAVNTNTYSKSGIPVMGWLFNFSDVLRQFLVRQYGQWQEYRAVDKTALRNFLFGKIEAMYEIPTIKA